ncbi:MAG TPA: hypothetical protein VLG36_00925 [Candidatus Chromulinivoraceae bacterium]|nr:hypothetical protein [Candidatus Chromulinivoraceae bacterium]
MRRRFQESGYIALLAVLIVGAAATAIGLTVLLTGTDSQRNTLAEQQSMQARDLANACTEEALQVTHDNIAFAGTNTLSLGAGSCTYVTTVLTGTTRSIAISATVGIVVRKIQAYVTIGSTSISVTSWQEVS